jgi:hypothetical protein
MIMERRLQELELLRRKYGQVDHGPNLDWVLFKTFPLPNGWNNQSTELLILIPPGYPTTPPDNFYVRNGLRLFSGAPPGNYSENQNLLGNSWGQFSFHAQSWNPSSDFQIGDSLRTFIAGVERRLAELN